MMRPAHEMSAETPATLIPAAGANASHQRYLLQAIPAGCWIGIDDLEFRAPEDLTGDEAAQAFFVLTGGIPGIRQTHGECENFWIEYDPAAPCVLALRAKQPSHQPPGNPFFYSPP